jgi:hypothetical protein
MNKIPTITVSPDADDRKILARIRRRVGMKVSITHIFRLAIRLLDEAQTIEAKAKP